VKKKIRGRITKIGLAFFCILLLPSWATAEQWVSLNQVWEKGFTEKNWILFDPRRVIHTADGGYAVLSNGFLLYKFGSKGNVEWYREIRESTPPYADNVGNDLIEVKGGGFLVVGSTNSDELSGRNMSKPFGAKSGNSRDTAPIAIKFASDGTEEWRRVIEPPEPGYKFGELDRAIEIKEGFLLMGRYLVGPSESFGIRIARRVSWLMQVSKGGEIVWKKFLDKELFAKIKPEGFDFTVGGDGNLVMAGSAYNWAVREPDGSIRGARNEEAQEYTLLLKLNENGEELYRTRIDRRRYTGITVTNNGYAVITMPLLDDARRPRQLVLYYLDEKFDTKNEVRCRDFEEFKPLGLVGVIRDGEVLAHGMSIGRNPFNAVLASIPSNGKCREVIYKSRSDASFVSASLSNDKHDLVLLQSAILNRKESKLIRYELDY